MQYCYLALQLHLTMAHVCANMCLSIAEDTLLFFFGKILPTFPSLAITLSALVEGESQNLQVVLGKEVNLPACQWNRPTRL